MTIDAASDVSRSGSNRKELNSIRLIVDDNDTRAFANSEFIQVNAKATFIRLIKQYLKESESAFNPGNQWFSRKDNRAHNTIMINGERGTGKTSFILSMKEEGLVSEFGNKVEVLDIVDPTLIESKESVLLNVIGLIVERVQETLGQNRSDEYAQWRKTLQNLALGLSVLDEIGSNTLRDSYWDNPALILDHGLSQVKAGAKLERNVSEFIHRSLGLLNKQAFILIFDDIDTSAKEGRKILEILRKYLTSRQLITVLLGDIDLYTSIVKQLQWENADPQGTIKQYADVKKLLPQVEHLETQYLTKIIKPENRIYLKPLGYLINRDNVEVTITVRGEPERLEVFLKTRLSALLLLQDHGQLVKLFCDTLLATPLRSIVHLAKLWKELPAPDYQHSYQSNQSIIAEHKEAFEKVYYSILEPKLSESDIVDLGYTDEFLSAFAMVHFKSNNWQTKAKLMPHSLSVSTNLRLIHDHLTSRYFVSPQHYLSYLIRVCYFLTCASNLDLNNGENGGASKQELPLYLGLQGVNNDRQLSRLLLAAATGPKNLLQAEASRADRIGAVWLTGSDSLTIGQVPPNNGKEEKEGLKPLVGSFTYSEHGNRVEYASVFNLLGALSAMLLEENDELRKQHLIHLNSMEGYRVFGNTRQAAGAGMAARTSRVDESTAMQKSSGDAQNGNSENTKASKGTTIAQTHLYSKTIPLNSTLVGELIKWTNRITEVSQPLSLMELDAVWSDILQTVRTFNENAVASNVDENWLNASWLAVLKGFYIPHRAWKQRQKSTNESPKDFPTFHDPHSFFAALKMDGYSDPEGYMSSNVKIHTFFDFLMQCPLFKWSELIKVRFQPVEKTRTEEQLKDTTNLNALSKTERVEVLKLAINGIDKWRYQTYGDILQTLQSKNFSGLREDEVFAVIDDMQRNG